MTTEKSSPSHPGQDQTPAHARPERYVNVVRRVGGRWVMEYECPIDGEELFEWFNPTLVQWLADRAVGRPACIVCRHDIVDRHRTPQTFLLIETDVLSKCPPKQVRLIDICDQCAAGSDDELRRLALRQLGGRASATRRIIGDNNRLVWEFMFGGSVFTINDDGSVHGRSPMTGRAPQHSRDIRRKPKPGRSER